MVTEVAFLRMRYKQPGGSEQAHRTSIMSATSDSPSASWASQLPWPGLSNCYAASITWSRSTTRMYYASRPSSWGGSHSCRAEFLN